MESLSHPTDWPFGSLTPFKYGAILVDIPWAYTMRSEKGYEKSPEAKYQTMTDQEILELPVNGLAGPTCWLFMWAIFPRLPFAVQVMERWGFKYVTGGSWHKKTPTGKTAFGTGYVLRSSCEPFILGKIGDPEIGSRSERNLIEAVRREHSRKPDDMRRKVEALTPSAWRCELFAREPWPGNEVWGNETTKFDSPANQEVS